MGLCFSLYTIDEPQTGLSVFGVRSPSLSHTDSLVKIITSRCVWIEPVSPAAASVSSLFFSFLNLMLFVQSLFHRRCSLSLKADHKHAVGTGSKSKWSNRIFLGSNNNIAECELCVV